MPDQAVYRVVVIDDDPDMAMYIKQILQRRSICEVVAVTDPMQALATVRSVDPDVVITDIEMPGMSGIELMKQLREGHPDLKVIVMTAHVSVDYAVDALRGQADEFLTKPIDSAHLVTSVITLAKDSRLARTATSGQVVLAIGAHPDDVEIGIGGTLAAHRAARDSIIILTLSRGARGGNVDSRQHESLTAAESLGARLFLEDLEDTRIAADGSAREIIERVVREIQPTIVYTHSSNDRHQDHRAVHEATMVATRTVPVVACYQSPSSTIDFRPNRFVTIDGYLDAKLELLRCYQSQSAIRNYLEPEVVTATARYWSRFGTGTSAEPLEIIRDSATLPASSSKRAAVQSISDRSRSES